VRKLRSSLSEVHSIEAWVEDLSSDQSEAEKLEQSQCIQDLEQKNSELTDTVTNLKTICKIQQEEALEESRRAIAHLEIQLQEVKRKQQEVATKFENIQQRQIELQEENNIATLQAMEFANKNVELQGKNESLTETLTARLKQQEFVLQNNKELTMEVAALKAKISTLQSLLSVEKDLGKQESDMRKVQLVSADEYKQKAVADLEVKDLTITALAMENAKLQDENMSLTERMQLQQNKTAQSADTFEREKTILEENISTLQFQVSETEQNKNSLQEEMQMVISESDTKDAVIASLRMELEQAHNQLEQVTLKYQSDESLHKKCLGM